jgi:hypothetical protein
MDKTNAFETANLSFSVPELSRRLECVDESQRDIIFMYIAGYSVEEIAIEHNVQYEHAYNTIRVFLDNLNQ